MDKNNIKYNCEWLVKELGNKRFDFYLPEMNTCIEFDGIQHFQIYKRYTLTEEELVKRQKFDIEKTNYCIKNKIRLLRISYIHINIINDILETFFEDKCMLFFSSFNLYRYLIDNIKKNINISVLKTGVGKLKA